jgi:hypothetical protein
MPPTLGPSTVHLAVLLAGGATLEAANPAVLRLVEDVLGSTKARRAGAFTVVLALIVLALLGLGAAAAAGYVGGTGGSSQGSDGMGGSSTSSSSCH